MLAAYQQANECFGHLKGSFFESRRAFRPLSLDPVPRLVMFGCERSIVNEFNLLRRQIVQFVSGVIPAFGLTRVRTLGSVLGVQQRHLLGV